MPFDYYLWQRGRSCANKKAQPSCSPDLPPIFSRKEDLVSAEKGVKRPGLQRLPVKERELRNFLVRANHKGSIIWVGSSNKEIYRLLQREISTSNPDQDVHVVFGEVHPGVEGQTEFFNSLLINGKARRRINGVTHLALEYNGFDQERNDFQGMVDRFLVSGQDIFELVCPKSWNGSLINRPMTSAAEMAAKNQTIKLARAGCYNLVLADLPDRISDKIEGSLGEYYSIVAREAFAVRRTAQRLNPNGKDVVFWLWGASHAEKYRLPLHIKMQDPKAKVVSVVMNGGTYVHALAFDRVVRSLGWEGKTFILKLGPSYREGDYVVHIPTKGRSLYSGISTKGDPVLQHIIEPSLNQQTAK